MSIIVRDEPPLPGLRPVAADAPEVAEPEHDEETGEITETLSERAANGIEKPKYWQRVEAIDGVGGPEFEEAFFLAQSEIESMVEADATANVTDKIKRKYATLAGLLARVRPILTKHRLTIKQFPGRIHRLGLDGATKQTFLPICTKLTHVDTGQAETFIWEMPLIKVDPQAIGSAATYGRRYAIAGIFGIATVDDDAAAASIRNRIDKEQGADVVDTLITQIKEVKTLVDLKKWYATHREGIEVLSDENIEKLRVAYTDKTEELKEAEAADPEAAKAGKAKK